MATYTVLTDDEKAQIKTATIRNLEYQLYAAEIGLIVENAKANPDSARIEELENVMSEVETQISALE